MGHYIGWVYTANSTQYHWGVRESKLRYSRYYIAVSSGSLIPGVTWAIYLRNTPRSRSCDHMYQQYIRF